MANLDLRRHLPSTAFVLLLLLGLAAAAGIFVYVGVYNVGADAPHTAFVYNFLDELRDRSIVQHSRDIRPPADLNSSKRVVAGAGLYNEMCTGCHLAPGVEPTEMSQGLYPPAPRLAHDPSHMPAQQFWIIKHGVKLTAMPAWGKTHSDAEIWAIVAFLQKLRGMSPEQYRALTQGAAAQHRMPG